MTKKFQPKYSVCRKLNVVYRNLWGLQSKDYYRSVFIFGRKKKSSYGEVMSMKQSLQLFYPNIRNYLFEYYVRMSIMSTSITVNKLVSLLESRLDCVLYRSCFVTSFQEARQVISHGLVKVNDLKAFLCGRTLHKGDIVKFNATNPNLENDTFSNILFSRSLPNYLELNFNTFTIVFLWDTPLVSVYYPLDIEYLNISRFLR